jgi:hypothetical protein
MKRLSLILVIAALGLVGCGKDDPVNLNPPPPGAVPVTPGVVPAASPNEVALNFVDAQTLSDFAKWPLNNPSNAKVKVLFSYRSGNNYGGSMTISFQDSGYYVSSPFTTGTTDEDIQFNYWMTMNGKSVFRAFFEDQGRPWKRVSGGVVIVIDNTTDLGDGATDPMLNGSLWFLNFEDSMAPQADKRCWLTQTGPYDCRAFLGGMASALYPELRTLSTGYQPGYKKLGTFSNLNMYKAFNQ